MWLLYKHDFDSLENRDPKYKTLVAYDKDPEKIKEWIKNNRDKCYTYKGYDGNNYPYYTMTEVKNTLKDYDKELKEIERKDEIKKNGTIIEKLLEVDNSYARIFIIMVDDLMNKIPASETIYLRGIAIKGSTIHNMAHNMINIINGTYTKDCYELSQTEEYKQFSLYVACKCNEIFRGYVFSEKNDIDIIYAKCWFILNNIVEFISHRDNNLKEWNFKTCFLNYKL